MERRGHAHARAEIGRLSLLRVPHRRDVRLVWPMRIATQRVAGVGHLSRPGGDTSGTRALLGVRLPPLPLSLYFRHHCKNAAGSGVSKSVE